MDILHIEDVKPIHWRTVYMDASSLWWETYLHRVECFWNLISPGMKFVYQCPGSRVPFLTLLACQSRLIWETDVFSVKNLSHT